MIFLVMEGSMRQLLKQMAVSLHHQYLLVCLELTANLVYHVIRFSSPLLLLTTFTECSSTCSVDAMCDIQTGDCVCFDGFAGDGVTCTGFNINFTYLFALTN
jgi:hypothetical protein